MKKTFSIRDLNDLSELVNSLGVLFTNKKEAWWRGHARSDWNLHPKIYRDKADIPKEFSLSLRFKNLAKVRHLNCPDNNDVGSWLYLMQHYGLPTRLLDWTHSAIIALYFAVREKQYHSEEGALWCVLPEILNEKQVGGQGIATAEDGDAMKLFMQAFLPSQYQKEKYIIAVEPFHFDIRHLVQNSVSTLHGSDTPLNKLTKYEEFLAYANIPADAKPDLLKTLGRLGFNDAQLFPDLGSLSQSLCDLYKDWTPPNAQ